jgi:hypothetical protein
VEELVVRGLSADFLKALKGGLLSPLLNRVKDDNTLLLSIRGNYINIYYRGGNLLRVKQNEKTGRYEASFEKRYLSDNLDIPTNNLDSDTLAEWLKLFPVLKDQMDIYFTAHPKNEREFQQLVVRENNNMGSISNSSDYFITDIEYADSDNGSRFDMTAIKWPADNRRNLKCRPVVVEMKYGEKALSGAKASLVTHLRDIDKFVTNNDAYKSILNDIEVSFNQLCELGLMLPQITDKSEIELDESALEIIIMIGNYNPRSSVLKRELENDEVVQFAKKYDLKFFTANFGGYGMYDNNMLCYDEFIKLLDNRHKVVRLIYNSYSGKFPFNECEWKGAKVLICSDISDENKEYWTNDRKYKVVVTPFSKEISWLLSMFRDIFAPFIDWENKYSFYCQFADAIEKIYDVNDTVEKEILIGGLTKLACCIYDQLSCKSELYTNDLRSSYWSKKEIIKFINDNNLVIL